MSGGRDLAHQGRTALGHPSEHEERGTHAGLGARLGDHAGRVLDPELVAIPAGDVRLLRVEVVLDVDREVMRAAFHAPRILRWPLPRRQREDAERPPVGCEARYAALRVAVFTTSLVEMPTRLRYAMVSA